MTTLRVHLPKQLGLFGEDSGQLVEVWATELLDLEADNEALARAPIPELAELATASFRCDRPGLVPHPSGGLTLGKFFVTKE